MGFNRVNLEASQIGQESPLCMRQYYLDVGTIRSPDDNRDDGDEEINQAKR